MTRYELLIHLGARLILGVVYIGLLLWTGAPPWAFVLFFAISTYWGPTQRRSRDSKSKAVADFMAALKARP